MKTNKLLNKIIHYVVYKGKSIEKFFGVMVLLCLLCYPFVGVNYDLSKYLPEFAPSKQALNVMDKEFGYPGLARIMVEDVSMYEAKDLQEKISNIDGVDMVMGLQTISDVYMGDSYIEDENIDTFYKDGCAVMDISFEKGDSDKETHKALDEIYRIVGDRGHYSGSAVSNKSRQESIQKEIKNAIIIAVVIILIILAITTNSWFEPFLFVMIMGVAIVINMGSNIIFGTISFFTFSTAAILQMAVSMDYSIFLLDSFSANKKSGMEKKEALTQAIIDSSSSILASGATTIVGFIVIALMKFTVGKDVGFVLTKGIIISLATVLLLMPALILRFDEKIEKYEHKSFMPSFEPLAKGMYKIRWIILVISIFVTVPSYFGQNMNHFLYGDDALGGGPGTIVYEDNALINEKFGKSNIVLAIVPTESIVKERDLTKELKNYDFVNYAISLSDILPEGVPQDFLPQSLTKQLKTENYARILVSMKTTQESDFAFSCSDTIEKTMKKYYPSDSYIIGMTPTTMDIKNILTSDYSRVSIISLIGVALVVYLTFRSFIVPLIVIIPIEVAIYLNMTIPYIIGDNLLYIGYIIVSCLQLGATIDYSILMTNNYLKARKTYPKHEASLDAISRSAMSILTSGSILTVVGYVLYFSSTIQGISQIGRLVGRGSLLSMLLVLSLLPALLVVFDSVISKQQAKSDARRNLLKEKRKPDIAPTAECNIKEELK